jgi:hypothetical protein
LIDSRLLGLPKDTNFASLLQEIPTSRCPLVVAVENPLPGDSVVFSDERKKVLGIKGAPHPKVLTFLQRVEEGQPGAPA